MKCSRTSNDYYSYDNDGFYANEYHMVSQYGTHVDAPCHFVIEGKSVDEIKAEEMILPLCVVDITGKVFEDEEKAVEMGEKAHAHAAVTHDRNKNAEVMMNIYYRVLEDIGLH